MLVRRCLRVEFFLVPRTDDSRNQRNFFKCLFDGKVWGRTRVGPSSGSAAFIAWPGVGAALVARSLQK
jgi:hypothetical protein